MSSTRLLSIAGFLTSGGALTFQLCYLYPTNQEINMKIFHFKIVKDEFERNIKKGDQRKEDKIKSLNDKIDYLFRLEKEKQSLGIL